MNFFPDKTHSLSANIVWQVSYCCFALNMVLTDIRLAICPEKPNRMMACRQLHFLRHHLPGESAFQSRFLHTSLLITAAGIIACWFFRFYVHRRFQIVGEVFGFQDAERLEAYDGASGSLLRWQLPAILDTGFASIFCSPRNTPLWESVCSRAT
jgi:hypothetical protein